MGEGENTVVPLAKVAWLVTVVVLLITFVILLIDDYIGYALVTLAVAASAVINLQ